MKTAFRGAGAGGGLSRGGREDAEGGTEAADIKAPLQLHQEGGTSRLWSPLKGLTSGTRGQVSEGLYTSP